MEIAIDVGGLHAGGAPTAFRRAMGTWRSEKEMEKLHDQFVDGCVDKQGCAARTPRSCSASARRSRRFGFAKSHAAAFARTAYESSFLKLFYPAQFTVGLINAQPMGFYPIEVLINDAKRHGVTVLPVDINPSSYKTATEWVGRPGWAMAGAAGDDGSHDGDPGEALPDGRGHRALGRGPCGRRRASCRRRRRATGGRRRARWARASAWGCGSSRGSARSRRRGWTRSWRAGRMRPRGRGRADGAGRGGHRAADPGRRARLAGSAAARAAVAVARGRRRDEGADGRADGRTGRASKRAAGRPMDLRLPATDAPPLPAMTETERLGDAYAVVWLDARGQVVGCSGRRSTGSGR